MAPSTINVLLTSFPGLGLPKTLSLPLPAASTVAEFNAALSERIPTLDNRLILTTNSNKLLAPDSTAPLSSLLPRSVSQSDAGTAAFLPLRLTAPLCGGKGGFGSQLRAAGGRMRKKRGAGENNGSSRNLDGRRLRTVTEAKALAEYLAVKPEMDQKQKAERRERWQEIVAMAERKEDEILAGGKKGRLDGQWVEAKEDAEERTRMAVLQALKNGDIKDVLGKESDASASPSEGSEGSESEEEIKAGASKPAAPPSRTFFGWDDDEDMSDEDEDEEEGPEKAEVEGKGKGKA